MEKQTSSVQSLAESYRSMQAPATNTNRPKWIPASIKNEQVEAFTKAIFEARANNTSIATFEGKQYKIKEAVFPELGNEKEMQAKSIAAAYNEPMKPAPTQQEEACCDSGNEPANVDLSKKIQVANKDDKETQDSAASMMRPAMAEEAYNEKMMDEENIESKQANLDTQRANASTGHADHHPDSKTHSHIDASINHLNAHSSHKHAAVNANSDIHNKHHLKMSDHHLNMASHHANEASKKAMGRDEHGDAENAHRRIQRYAQGLNDTLAAHHATKAKEHHAKALEEGLYTTEEAKQEDENVGTFHLKKQQAQAAGKTSFEVGGEKFPVKNESTQDAWEEEKHLDEVLNPSDTASKWIHDFVHSKNPKFAGKSKEMRQKMALGAYYSAQKESVQVNSTKNLLSVAEAYAQMQKVSVNESTNAFPVADNPKKDGGPDNAVAGPEVMDPTTQKMRDAHVKNVNVDDSAEVGAAQDGADALKQSDLPAAKPEDAVIPKLKESTLKEDEEGDSPDWHGGYVSDHEHASKPTLKPKHDDHVHSRAIDNHGFNSDDFASHKAQYEADHPGVTVHHHAEGDPDHAVSYSGPRHAVAKAVQYHHSDNQEASRYGRPPVRKLHPEIFKGYTTKTDESTEMDEGYSTKAHTAAAK